MQVLDRIWKTGTKGFSDCLDEGCKGKRGVQDDPKQLTVRMELLSVQRAKAVKED